MAKTKKREEYINQSGLKERGWTVGKIDLWLGDPDRYAINPFYRSAAKQKLYLLKRVKQQERNKRFKQWLLALAPKREKQSKAMIAHAEKQREKIKNHIENLKIVFPNISQKRLTSLAVKHYNELWLSRDDYEKHASINDDPEFLKRITINFLRHNFNNYEYRLDRLFGKTGRVEAYELLKQRINQEIIRRYPFLK